MAHVAVHCCLYAMQASVAYYDPMPAVSNWVMSAAALSCQLAAVAAAAVHTSGGTSALSNVGMPRSSVCTERSNAPAV
jgi:hypothetical protein